MMKLQRIYASKLYLTSSRKDRIHAAMNDSKNGELVQQLSEYLDEADKAKLDEIVREKKAAAEASKAEKVAEEALSEVAPSEDIPDERNVFSPSYSGGGSFNPPSGNFDDFASEPSSSEDAPESEGGEPAPEPPADEPVQESTAIYGEIKADTGIGDILSNIASEAATIKGTLNGKAETAGVQRIAVDDKELWIYYEDDVNTRDIMVDVIEALNASAYTYLEFSRLARSNNAIVFDINLNTKEPIKSIKEVEEENK